MTDEATFEQVVSLAIRAENNFNEARAEQHQPKKAGKNEHMDRSIIERVPSRPQFLQKSATSGRPSGSSFQPFRACRTFTGTPRRSQVTSEAPFSDQHCEACGRRHVGPCVRGSIMCYACGQSRHVRSRCPMVTRSIDRNLMAAGSSTPSVSQRPDTWGKPPQRPSQGNASRATTRVYVLN